MAALSCICKLNKNVSRARCAVITITKIVTSIILIIKSMIMTFLSWSAERVECGAGVVQADVETGLATQNRFWKKVFLYRFQLLLQFFWYLKMLPQTWGWPYVRCPARERCPRETRSWWGAPRIPPSEGCKRPSGIFYRIHKYQMLTMSLPNFPLNKYNTNTNTNARC